MKAPMDEPLHPSTLSEILDRTAQLYRSRFLVFLGIAALPTAVLLLCVGIVAVLVLRVEPGTGANSAFAGVLVALVVGCVFLFAVPVVLGATALAMAAMSHAAARAFLGQPIGIRSSYRATWPRGWRAVGLYVFEIVVIWVVPFSAWFVAVMLSSMLAILGGGPAGGAVFTVAIVVIVAGLVTYGFWMSIRVSLAFPAMIVEQTGAWDALRRSAALTKGTKGRILVLLLLGVTLNFILSLAISIPLVMLINLMPGANTPQHIQTHGVLILLAVYGSGFAVQALTRPITGIALILFYYDQRIRQEAFDIEWMMLQAGLIVPSPAPAPPLIEPQPVLQPEPPRPQPIQPEPLPALAATETSLPPDPGAAV
jgi:Membrane domain of glycerophosphoryl diester phosphodiesterase